MTRIARLVFTLALLTGCALPPDPCPVGTRVKVLSNGRPGVVLSKTHSGSIYWVEWVEPNGYTLHRDEFHPWQLELAQ